MSSTEPRPTPPDATATAAGPAPAPAGLESSEGIRRHARRWPWLVAAAPLPLVAALVFPKFWILLTAYSGKLLITALALFLLQRRWARRKG